LSFGRSSKSPKTPNRWLWQARWARTIKSLFPLTRVIVRVEIWDLSQIEISRQRAEYRGLHHPSNCRVSEGAPSKKTSGIALAPNAELLEFGEAFYLRRSGRHNAAQSAGNLSRTEAQAPDFRAKINISPN
jgi:hypothetical protein